MSLVAYPPGGIKITDGVDEATIRDLGTTKAIDVAIVDGSGNQITSFGGGGGGGDLATETTLAELNDKIATYQEDTASVGGELLHLVGAIREDADYPTAATSADGDYSSLITDSYGRLRVTSVTVGVDGADVPAFIAAGIHGNDKTERRALRVDNSGSLHCVEPQFSVAVGTASPGSIAMLGAFGKDTPPSAGSNDHAVRLWADLNGRLMINTDQTLAVSLASCPLPTDAATETTLSALNDKIATYQEDATSAGGELLHLAGAVRRDAASEGGLTPAATSATGDYSAISVDAMGRVNVCGTHLSVGGVSYPGFLVAGMTSGIEVPGPIPLTNTGNAVIVRDLSTGAPDDPLPSVVTNIGGVGKDTAPTPSGDGSVTRAWFDRSGRTMIKADALPLPAGAATETTLAALDTKVTVCDTDNVTVSSTVAVSGPLTDTQLRASAVLMKKLGSSSIATDRVAVGTSATLIVAARSGRKRITLVNAGTSVAFVGTSGVITTTGLRVNVDTPIVLETEAAIYGIVSSGTANVTYLEEYD